jgi:hypothetical protein
MRKIMEDVTLKLLPKIDWINWNVPGTFSYVSDHHNHKNEHSIMNGTIRGYQVSKSLG